MDLPLTTQKVNKTVHTGELDENTATRFLKEAVCAQLGISPNNENLYFRAWFSESSGGLSIKRCIKYELSIHHDTEDEDGS